MVPILPHILIIITVGEHARCPIWNQCWLDDQLWWHILWLCSKLRSSGHYGGPERRHRPKGCYVSQYLFCYQISSAFKKQVKSKSDTYTSADTMCTLKSPRTMSTVVHMMATTNTLWMTSFLPELFSLHLWWLPWIGQISVLACVNQWHLTLRTPTLAKAWQCGFDSPMKWTTTLIVECTQVDVS